jgi:hypothetical protein
MQSPSSLQRPSLAMTKATHAAVIIAAITNAANRVMTRKLWPRRPGNGIVVPVFQGMMVSSESEELKHLEMIENNTRSIPVLFVALAAAVPPQLGRAIVYRAIPDRVAQGQEKTFRVASLNGNRQPRHSRV